jgi:hypothetical protein
LVEFGGLAIALKMVGHFEAITSNAIHGLAEFLGPSRFTDHPRPFFERRPMPDMLFMAAAQKSYPVAVFVKVESGYRAAHLTKSRNSSGLIEYAISSIGFKAMESKANRRLCSLCSQAFISSTRRE